MYRVSKSKEVGQDGSTEVGFCEGRRQETKVGDEEGEDTRRNPEFT